MYVGPNEKKIKNQSNDKIEQDDKNKGQSALNCFAANSVNAE